MIIALVALLTVSRVVAEEAKAEHLAHFNDKVLPLLQAKCSLWTPNLRRATPLTFARE